jgi:hypothetical protein
MSGFDFPVIAILCGNSDFSIRTIMRFIAAKIFLFGMLHHPWLYLQAIA